MTAQQKHEAIGAALVGAAFVYLVFLRHPAQAADAAAPGAAPPLPAEWGVSPAPTTTAGAAIPGTDIQLGGSPAYLTYNFPAMLDPLLSNPSWGIATAPQPEGETTPAAAGGSCCGCDSEPSLQWTNGGIVSNYWPLMQAGAANYASVGLDSTGAAPTGYR